MNKRRRLTGIVKSNKMDKTVIVEVTRTFQHPLYKKVVRSTKAYKAHDELGCNLGDKVVIVETAPFSATVTWAVEEIVKVEIRQEGVETVEEMIEQTISVLEADEEVEAEEVETEEVETEEVETLEEVTVEAAEEVEEEVAEVVEDEEEEAA
ncbi:MAG TPA: 30S ribosomal protein S17 [Chloroflexi bacterium]|jgi:small subunit ribosomal protein S17|nr:30S ribosomal protein S17 [Chloroflexota bacterium]